MKKILVTILAVVIIFSGVAVSYGAEYTDVKASNWAYDAVNTMSNKAIIKGYPDGSFKPNNTITYGEFIKMALIAGTGQDVGNASSGHWATNYYNKALELKYFTNADISKTQLKDQITRAHMALIVSSILGDVKINDYNEIQKGIKDVTYQTKYEYDITKAYATGILTGYTDNTFRPDKTLTRAESAMVVYRLVDESKREIPGGENEEPIPAKVYKTSELLNMSQLTPDKIGTKYANFTDTYELYPDATVWNVKMYRNFDGEDGSFDHELKGFIYLVKDGVIVDYCQTTPKYDENGNYLNYQRSMFKYDITKADYIMSVPSNDKDAAGQLIQVIVNPFKK